MNPIIIENSKVPIILSLISPIDISAITIFPFVFSIEKMSEQEKNHEKIHFQQYIETLVIGFYILYLFDYMIGIYKYNDGNASYFRIRAEQEAYEFESDLEYLRLRDRWSWIFKYNI
jgi:uncharacterized membrane protein YjgN (DUF898 family)